MKKLYCPECNEYLEGGSGNLANCHCGWKQPDNQPRKFLITIEYPGGEKQVEFEAENLEDADEIGKQEFFGVCNYGISEV